MKKVKFLWTSAILILAGGAMAFKSRLSHRIPPDLYYCDFYGNCVLSTYDDIGGILVTKAPYPFLYVDDGNGTCAANGGNGCIVSTGDPIYKSVE